MSVSQTSNSHNYDYISGIGRSKRANNQKISDPIKNMYKFDSFVLENE